MHDKQLKGKYREEIGMVHNIQVKRLLSVTTTYFYLNDDIMQSRETNR